MENMLLIQTTSALGVDTETMLIAQPSSGEEGFQIAVELMQTGDVDMVIIDSDSSLIPKAVLDGAVGEHAIGKKARLNSSAYPKLKSIAHNTNTCLIVISQYREKIVSCLVTLQLRRVDMH